MARFFITRAPGLLRARRSPALAGVVPALACVLLGACGVGDTATPDCAPSPDATAPIVAALDREGLTTMAGLVRVAGLAPRLTTDGPFTLVAPDEHAFQAMPDDARRRRLERREQARAFVLDHLLGGALPPGAVTDGLQTRTMYVSGGLAEAGHRLQWSVDGATVSVEEAHVTATLPCANGVVYVVDALLPPPPQVWARPSRASPGDPVTVTCRWARADGTPVAGARCIVAWHFDGDTRHDEARTDGEGIARCTRVVPPRPGAGTVLVTVTASGAAPTRTVVATFTVR